MSKRRLSNILKRKFNLKLPEAGQGKTVSEIWGETQVKKLGSLKQGLVTMQMN